MKLIDLKPQFLKLRSPLRYTPTNDIKQADAMQLVCPSCQWAGQDRAHLIQLWPGKPAFWNFEGTGYNDLSLRAGRLAVTLYCHHCEFWVKNGKVDFA